MGVKTHHNKFVNTKINKYSIVYKNKSHTHLLINLLTNAKHPFQSV